VVSGNTLFVGAVLGAAVGAMDIAMWDIPGQRSIGRCTSCWEERAAIASRSSPPTLAKRGPVHVERECSHAKGIHLSRDDCRLPGL
jgi:hypothetical protein